MLIDIHAHLTNESFEKDIDAVVNNSSCSVILCNGTNPQDNRAVLKICKRYNNVKPALGIYPEEILKLTDKEIEDELKFIKKQHSAAIGEVGLDGTYGNLEKQSKYFRKFISLAEELNIPIIVHNRKAEKEVIDILEELKAKKVILHCFMGKLKYAERAEKLGYHFSIPPIIVYAGQFQEMVKKISITRLLTETDAPYLGPVKGERNEPANVQITVKKIAELKGMDAKEVENSIYLNYQRLFAK